MKITKEAIKEAYEKTGLKPIRNKWVEFDSGNITCACGMSVLFADKTSIEELTKLIDGNKGITFAIADKLGIDRVFLCGFTDAFDGVIPHPNSRLTQYNEGYRLGEETRQYIFTEV